MTVHGHELVASRRGQSATDKSPEFEWQYALTGSNLAIDGATWILANSPLTVLDPVTLLTLVRDQIYWEPLKKTSYTFRVVYVDPSKQDENRQLQEGEYKYSFDTTGGTLHITSSLQTIASYHRGTAPFPPAKCGIGQTETGEVSGVDIVVPVLKTTFSYRFPYGIITDAFIRTIEEMTGKKNDATFKGRPAGEFLFLGGSGSQGNKTGPQLDFHFVRQPNRASFSIGDIAIATKKGHDYLWLYYASEKDSSVTPPVIARTPVWAKVEEVYADGDFSTLGVGS